MNDSPDVGNDAPGSADLPDLPELQYNQVSKSPNAILLDGSKPECLHFWGSYTLVKAADSGQLVLLDEEGIPVEDFESISNAFLNIDEPEKFIVEKLNAIARRDGEEEPSYKYLSKDPSSEDVKDFQVGRFPPQFKYFLLRTLLRSPKPLYIHLNKISNTRMSLLDSPVIHSVDNGRYILVIDPEKSGSIIFDTHDDHGQPQPPRNWKQVDTFSDVNYPESVMQYMHSLDLIHGERNNKSLGGGNYAQTRSDEILFFDPTRRSPNHKILVLHREKIRDAQICVDPMNPTIVYFCRTERPREMMRMDMSGEPDTWRSESTAFTGFDAVENLRMDPSGNFFLFDQGEEIAVVDRFRLEEVGRFPGNDLIQFDSQGRIHTFDDDGHLVIYEMNLGEIAQSIETRRATELLQGLDIKGLFGTESGPGEQATESRDDLGHLEPLKSRFTGEFQSRIDGVSDVRALEAIGEALEALRRELSGRDLGFPQIRFVTEDIETSIQEKRKELAEPMVRETVDSVRDKLDRLSVSTIGEVRDDIEKAEAMRGLVEESLRHEVDELSGEFQKRVTEFFQTEGERFIKEVDGLMDRVREDLAEMDNQSAFSDWQEYTCPQLKSRLGMLDRDCPIEAGDAHARIVAARHELQALETEYEERFEEQYAQVREEASSRTNEMVDMIAHDISGFLERVQRKNFRERTKAQAYIDNSGARNGILEQIELLRERDPDKANELDRMLKVETAMVIGEVGRGGEQQVDKAGRQTVSFGGRRFLKWEAAHGDSPRKEDAEAAETRVDLTFVADERTKGPGIKPKDIYGDVSLRIEAPDGEVKTVHLFEGMGNESDWRYGGVEIQGVETPATYMTQSDYRELRKNYRKWGTAENPGPLRQELAEKYKVLKDHLKKRPQDRDDEGKKVQEGDEFNAWHEAAQKLVEEFAYFRSENHIALLRRLERVQNVPSEVEETNGLNGKGFVPGWSPHWTMDRQTEEYLEDMAKYLQMQSDLQEGVLNLSGHAGTGKDVLVKMFCNRTNRPYFAFDCSKWVTEFELSEDMTMDSEEGMAKLKKIRSIVLEGIQTPGAVVYFNEFNAMPEQAQLYLHALLDEKRSMTLKTSGGKTVKSEESNLFICSMNPDYPGTFAPQFATRSRMHTMDVDYPPLMREAASDDANQSPIYDSSEALRLARSTESLRDLTYDPNYETNEFAHVWDRYVNQMDNGAKDLTPEQQFDLDVILGLIQFGAKLREGFKVRFEKRSDNDSRNIMKNLPVGQPLTLREMRRCAWHLSTQITPDQKRSKELDPEQVAKELIYEFFLPHIANATDREKIETQMSGWTTEKRMSQVA